MFSSFMLHLLQILTKIEFRRGPFSIRPLCFCTTGLFLQLIIFHNKKQSYKGTMTGRNKTPNHSIWGHFLLNLENDGKSVISYLVSCIRDHSCLSKTQEIGEQLIIVSKADRSQTAWTKSQLFCDLVESLHHSEL